MAKKKSIEAASAPRKTRKPDARNGAAPKLYPGEGPAPAPLADALARQFSTVKEVDAVFAYMYPGGVMCLVYTVIEDFKDGVGDKLMRREDRLVKEFPEIAFDFRMSVHQGRNPALAVPIHLPPIYLRNELLA